MPQMVIRGPRGERIVNAEDYWIGPGIDITRMTVLRPNELLVAIRIPATMGRRAVLLREGPRPPGLGLSARQRRGGHQGQTAANIGEVRLVVNAVAATPKRLKNVEAAVVGKPRNEETAEMAGEMAVEGARTLRHNGYKVPLMRNLVKRAIRGGRAAMDLLNGDGVRGASGF